jgi:hypothetical protein
VTDPAGAPAAVDPILVTRNVAESERTKAGQGKNISLSGSNPMVVANSPDTQTLTPATTEQASNDLANLGEHTSGLKVWMAPSGDRHDIFSFCGLECMMT